MAFSLRVPGKFKLRRSDYKRGQKKGQEWCSDLQEFTFNSDADSDGEITVIETHLSNRLRKRDTQTNSVELWPVREPTYSKSKKQFIDYEVQAEDSLQSISLRFGCQVAELKQANKFMTDQDFYAYPSIRIPVPENGVLTEELRQKNAVSEEAEVPADNVVNLSIRQMLTDDSSMVSQSFLEAMDKDIKHIVETTQSQVLSETEALTMPRFYTMASSTLNDCDGSNWGLSWRCLMIVLITIGVVTPALYGILKTANLL